MKSFESIYNDYLNVIIDVLRDYESGKNVKTLFDGGDRMLYLGVTLLLMSIFLIPVIA
jgi:hypothetical protein